MTDDEKSKLTPGQTALLWGEGFVSLIPYVGSLVTKVSFGAWAERRVNRIERTLAEVVQTVGEETARAADNESFINLLEKVLPEIGRAVDEEKRQRFRDLLTNAAELTEDSSEWGATALAAELLKDIDTPGLAILAGMAQLDEGETCLLTAFPQPQVLRGVKSKDFAPDNPGEPQHVIPYEWPVVEYWYRQLSSRRLVAAGAHGRDTFENTKLTDLGRFLVKWVLRETASPCSPPTR